MRRLIANAPALAAAVIGGLGVLCCPALAGSYVVSACSPTTFAGLWVQTNTFPTALRAENQCGGGPALGPTDGSHAGALYGEDVLNSSADIPDGSRAGWTLTAPAGAKITAISYYRTLSAYNDQDVVSGLFQGDGVPLEQCKIPWPFVHGSSIHCDKVNNQAPVTFTGLSTSSLFFGVMCRIVTGATACISGGAPLHAATADLYSARVTLSESVAPTLSGVGGALWGGGIVSGVVPVTFAASDASGIQEQLVRGDAGQTLISVLGRCDFSASPPCQQQLSGSLSVDTSRVADGAHTFSVVVSDPAGNSQVATSPAVVVDNDGPPAPALTATAEGAGSNVIRLSWRNPSSPPAPITNAMVQLCETTCLAATSVGTSGAARLITPGPGLYRVRLWLLDALGRGGDHNAALTTVTVPAARASTVRRSKVTAVFRGRRLRVSAIVMRSGRVRVSWRSKIGSRTVGHGSRVVRASGRRIAVTFTVPKRARTRRAMTRVAVRAGSRIVAQTRAHRG